jgi:NAD(P)-dependent dehydrogenase (short-subunit alcohol dehydrogenase family)
MTLALITGASRGLGRSAALKLAQRGIDIILTYHSQKEAALEAVKDIEAMGRKALALPLDTGKISEFKTFAHDLKAGLSEHFGTDSFDYLVNNAGHGVYAPISDTTEEQFDGLVNVHFKGVFFLTQALLPLIRDEGRILNISSGLTRFSYEGYAAYAAMKGAVEVLTRYMAKELGPRRISVNVLAPGAIETDFGGGAVRDNADLNAVIAAQTALGRVGVPEDIGGAIASILSDDNRWLNGQRIEASGGIYL